MNWRDWLEKWGMTSLRIKMGLLESEWKPQDPDKNAAWEMYVELVTRITTHPMQEEDGNDSAALSSVYQLFPITRQVLREQGRGAVEFAKLAVVILNQKIRPFTSKWHRICEEGKLAENHFEFRRELAELQSILLTYTKMLGDMAGVEEDLCSLDD